MLEGVAAATGEQEAAAPLTPAPLRRGHFFLQEKFLRPCVASRGDTGP
jgi:hypothetical protein